MKIDKSTLYVVGMLASIAFALSAIPLVGVIMDRLPWYLAFLALLFIIPVYPAATAMMQGEARPTIANLVRGYLLAFVELAFEFLFIAGSLPVIAAGLAGVVMGLMAVLMLVGVALWFVKFGLAPGILPGIARGDIVPYLAILYAFGALVIVGLTVRLRAERAGDTLVGWWIETRARLKRAVRRR